jgi:hypothetical protein
LRNVPIDAGPLFALSAVDDADSERYDQLVVQGAVRAATAKFNFICGDRVLRGGRCVRAHPSKLEGIVMIRQWAAIAGISLVALWCAATAPAQAAPAFPSRALRIVVPFPPGGTSDILSRTIGQKLTEEWGQPVVADNRAGAAGNITSEFVARSKPDG